MPTEHHPFEPFLPDGARILFLGSFPPQPHRWCMPFYYPNWINDFWRIMGLIHFGDKNHFCLVGEKRFDEGAIRSFCTSEGLAFYDTACEVRRLRDNASDAFLEVVTPTDIPAPCWPASRNVTPSSPPVKKPAASSPRPSAALYRPLEALWTSVLTASGACPPLPAPIPCRWKRRLTPIGNYSDYSSKPAFLSKLISLSLPQTSSAPPA